MDRPAWVRHRSTGQAFPCTQMCLLQQVRRRHPTPVSTTTPTPRACHHRLPPATSPKSMSLDLYLVLGTLAAMTCTICTASVKHRTWTTSASALPPHWSVCLKRSSFRQMTLNRSTLMISSSRLTNPPPLSSIGCKPVWDSNPSRSLLRTFTICLARRIHYQPGRPISLKIPFHLWMRATSASPGRSSFGTSCCFASYFLSPSPNPSCPHRGLRCLAAPYHHLNTVFI